MHVHLKYIYNIHNIIIKCVPCTLIDYFVPISSKNVGKFLLYVTGPKICE